MFSTDKVEHGYLPFYETMTAGINVRARAMGYRPAIIELGVRDGASMHMWRELLPDAVIIGVDNSAQANRTVDGTYFVESDQADPQLVVKLDRILRYVCGPPFPPKSVFPRVDMIVDDCSHDGELTWKSFTNLWPLLRMGGAYVIEDWYVGGPDWPDYDTSMLDLVHRLVDTQLDRDDPIVGLQVRYGLCAAFKRDNFPGGGSQVPPAR